MRYLRTMTAMWVAIMFMAAVVVASADVQEIHDITVAGNTSLRITSPNYPSHYPNNTDEVWILRTEKNHKFAVSFSEFRVDTYNDGDYLQVGDGTNVIANQFFEENGWTLPPKLLSYRNEMWLRFVSDYRWTAPGFVLDATSVPATEMLPTCSATEFDCGHSICIRGTLRCDRKADCFGGKDEHNCDEDRFLYIGANQSAQLASTRYPSSYIDNIQITWILQTEEDRKIRISFTRFDTEYWYDVFQAGDGKSSALNEFFRWSGNRNPPDLLSAGNTMWLRFTADESNREQGFQLTAFSVPSTDSLACSPDQFDCGHSVCIESSWQCDDVQDCSDGGDELGPDCDSRDIFLSANETATISISSYLMSCMWLVQTEEDRKILITYPPGYFSLSGSFVLRAGNGDNSTNFADMFFSME